jgi:hypothetical protein
MVDGIADQSLAHKGLVFNEADSNHWRINPEASGIHAGSE